MTTSRSRDAGWHHRAWPAPPGPGGEPPGPAVALGWGIFSQHLWGAFTQQLQTLAGERPVKAILDAYNPTGSTSHVNFTTSKALRWQTTPHRSHVNWVVCDSDWEAEFCRVAEAHPRVLAYVKNQGLGFEVPYLLGSTPHRYRPDFLLRIDDGGAEPLNLVVEIKGFRGEDAVEKANTMRAYWVPGVNNLQSFGRWAFAEFTEVFEIEAEFGRLMDQFSAAQPAAAE